MEQQYINQTLRIEIRFYIHSGPKFPRKHNIDKGAW